MDRDGWRSYVGIRFTFILWIGLAVVSLPLALLVLVVYPVVWVLSLPFHLVGISVSEVLDLPRDSSGFPAASSEGPPAEVTQVQMPGVRRRHRRPPASQPTCARNRPGSTAMKVSMPPGGTPDPPSDPTPFQAAVIAVVAAIPRGLVLTYAGRPGTRLVAGGVEPVTAGA